MILKEATHFFLLSFKNMPLLTDGQTGTGKTYTMEGYNHGSTTSETGGNIGVEARGIIPRAIEQIFGHIQRNASPRMRFLVRASYLQIYNEQVGPPFSMVLRFVSLIICLSIRYDIFRFRICLSQSEVIY